MNEEQTTRPASILGIPEKSALYVTFVVALLGGLLTLVNIRSQQRYARSSLVERAVLTTGLVADSTVDPVASPDGQHLRQILRGVMEQEEVLEAQLYGPAGELVALGRARPGHPVPESIGGELPEGTEVWSDTDGLVTMTPILHGGRTLGYVRVVWSTAGVERDVVRIHRANLTLGAVLLACTLLLSFLLMRRVMRPLDSLIRATRSLAQGDFDTRVPARGRDEIAVLAGSFNSMAEALQSSMVSREELSNANRELERARAAEAASNRAKSEFLANVSHEIRTPLTAILGYAELLQENSADEPSRDAANTILTNGRHLLSILDDILDLSKVEAGKMRLELIRCSPIRIANDVYELMRVRADAKGLTMRLAWRMPIPQTIESDPTRIRQILVNLIGNAIKFTESGYVELEVGLATEGSATEIQFAVRDTGIGMSEEQVSRLFVPFTQADETTSRRFGGTGLGLTITQRCAELLGGRIDVRSAPGVGSTFRVSLPTGALVGVPLLEDAEAELRPRSEMEPAASEHAERPLSGLRILLAEDGPDNQKLFSFFLRKLGAEVEIACDGEQACDRALEARDAGETFDIVLMDMQMPGVDGYTATRRLRDADYDGTIVALTAHTMAGDRERCIDAGCDDYATKPLQRHRLVEIIRARVGRVASRG